MKHVVPLLCALLVCALTAVLAALFARGNALAFGLASGAGALVASLAYHAVSRRITRSGERK
jgi:hypothetical protein